MLLRDDARNDLKDLKAKYEDKSMVADISFIENVFDILKHESKFYWTMKYSFVDYSIPGSINMSDREIKINYDKFIKKCESIANTWKSYYKIEDVTPIINIYVIYGLLHESAHLWQVCGLDNNSEINRFYKELYKKLDNLSPILWYKYYKNPEKLSFERHANVDSYREVAKIYSDSFFHDVAEASHMYSLDYLKNNYSPVLRTMKDAFIKNNFDFTGLSLEEIIEFGAPIDEDVFNKFDDILIRYAREVINYHEAQEQIKKLSR